MDSAVSLEHETDAGVWTESLTLQPAGSASRLSPPKLLRKNQTEWWKQPLENKTKRLTPGPGWAVCPDLGGSTGIGVGC